MSWEDGDQSRQDCKTQPQKTKQKSTKKKHYKHTHPFPALISISLRLRLIICGTQSQIPINSFPFISLLHKLQKMFLP